MKIDCGQAGCKSTFETLGLPVRKTEQLLYQHHWVRRGSVTGVFYYCPNHNPDNEIASTSRRREKQQRGPRISSACPPRCRERPLFDLLGHDETGHRTARRLRDYLVHQAYEALGNPADRLIPAAWANAFDTSDAPVEMLLEMTGADIRRIPGIGQKSLARITEVLGRLD